jgi:YHS domain-containing protein
MFVDVEFPVNLPPTIMVPADALLYSGLMQTVFIDRGSGYFEPRHVETGMRLGDQVEITSGLAPGEKIVVSGNFLIGSESRMKMAGAGLYGTVSKDPLCGMDVDENKASAAGRKSEYQGKTYFFCSDGCKQKFDAEPQRFLQKPPERRPQSAPSGTEAPPRIEGTKDLVCGMSVDPGKAEAAGLKTLYQGKAYYFCNEGCMKEFKKNPGRYLEKVSTEGDLTAQPLHSAATPDIGGRHD